MSDGLDEYHAYVRQLEDAVIAAEAVVVSMIQQLCDLHRTMDAALSVLGNSCVESRVSPFGSPDVRRLLRQVEDVTRRRSCGNSGCASCVRSQDHSAGGFASVEVSHE